MVDIALWTNEFSELPSWRCPTCQSGTLRENKDRTVIHETGLSVEGHKHDAWDPDWNTERFAAFLDCVNPNCKETVIVSGSTRISLEHNYDYRGDASEDWVRWFRPKSIEPAVPMFLRHEEYGDAINSLLYNAFKLYWSDREACANKFRSCIEAFLLAQGVPATGPLHQRILNYGQHHVEEAKLLMSVKWIGNEGTHATSSFSVEDLFHCAAVIQHVLEEAYLGRKRKLLEKADEINSRYSASTPAAGNSQP